MSVVVWTAVTDKTPLPFPITYPTGVATKIADGCLEVVDAAGATVSAWGTGQWQRSELK